MDYYINGNKFANIHRFVWLKMGEKRIIGSCMLRHLLLGSYLYVFFKVKPTGSARLETDDVPNEEYVSSNVETEGIGSASHRGEEWIQLRAVEPDHITENGDMYIAYATTDGKARKSEGSRIIPTPPEQVLPDPIPLFLLYPSSPTFTNPPPRSLTLILPLILPQPLSLSVGVDLFS